MISIKKGALAVSKGTGSVLEFLSRASGKLEPLRAAPFVGDSIADVQDVVSMRNDYYHGRYKAFQGSFSPALLRRPSS